MFGIYMYCVKNRNKKIKEALNLGGALNSPFSSYTQQLAYKNHKQSSLNLKCRQLFKNIVSLPIFPKMKN